MINEYIRKRRQYYEALTPEFQEINIVQNEKASEYLLTMMNMSTDELNSKIIYNNDVNIHEGSTSYVISLGNQCLKIMKKDVGFNNAKIYLNDIVNNIQITNSLRRNLHIPQNIAINTIRKVMINEYINGMPYKKLNKENYEIYMVRIIELVSAWLREGYYDDDFTPSNLLFKEGKLYNIDLGYVSKIGNKVNPYMDSINFNMIERMIYKNIMVSLQRKDRENDDNSAFNEYCLFFSKLKDMEIPMSLRPFLRKQLNLFENNKVGKYRVDKLLSNYIILSENISDMYFDDNSVIRLNEMCKIIKDISDAEVSIIKNTYNESLYNININIQRFRTIVNSRM